MKGNPLVQEYRDADQLRAAIPHAERLLVFRFQSYFTPFCRQTTSQDRSESTIDGRSDSMFTPKIEPF